MEIDNEDCKVIVKRYIENDNFNVENFLITPLNDDNINGYSCNYANLLIDINTDDDGRKRLRFFCKTLLDVSVIGDKNEVNTLDKELFVYRYFCTSNFAPKFLHVKNNTLILEDLKLNDYQMLDDDYLDINHIKLTLNCLVRLHSNSIIYEIRKGNNYKLYDDKRAYFQEHLHSDNEDTVGHRFTECGKRAVCTLFDLIPTFNVNDRQMFKRNLNESMNEFYKLINECNLNYRNVCNHGDIWRKNIMFHYKNGTVDDCKLIDFQLCRYLPPAHDVTMTIHHLGSDQLRKESYDYLLNYYYDSLANELSKEGLLIENILPRTEYDFTCKLYALPAKILRAIYPSLSSSSQESQREIFADPIAAMEITCNDRSTYVINEYEKNVRYRTLMTKVINNLNDGLINNDVTLEDCHKILNDIYKSDYVLLDYYTESFNTFAGYLGEYKLLNTLVLKSNGERVSKNFFVKMMPKFHATVLFLKETGAHYKEYAFFKNILPKLKEYNVNSIEELVPKCYVFRLNDLAMFENLTSQNYVMLDKRESMTYDLVKFTLKHMATFHGSFYVYEEKLSELNGKPHRLIDEFRSELEKSFFGNGEFANKTWSAVIKGALTSIDLFFKYEPEMINELTVNVDEFKERVKLFLTDSHVYGRPSNTYRNALCHGDLWTSNILYKFDDDGKPLVCKFVDYQTYRYVSPTQDIFTFLYTTTYRSFRDKYLNELIDYYYDELKRLVCKSGYDLNSILTYDDYKKCCEYNKRTTLIKFVVLSQMIFMKAEMAEDIFSIPGYYDKIIYDDRSELIIKLCEEDDVSRKKIFECIVELIDYFGK